MIYIKKILPLGDVNKIRNENNSNRRSGIFSFTEALDQRLQIENGQTEGRRRIKRQGEKENNNSVFHMHTQNEKEIPNKLYSQPLSKVHLCLQLVVHRESFCSNLRPPKLFDFYQGFQISTLVMKPGICGQTQGCFCWQVDQT